MAYSNTNVQIHLNRSFFAAAAANYHHTLVELYNLGYHLNMYTRYQDDEKQLSAYDS